MPILIKKLFIPELKQNIIVRKNFVKIKNNISSNDSSSYTTNKKNKDIIYSNVEKIHAIEENTKIRNITRKRSLIQKKILKRNIIKINDVKILDVIKPIRKKKIQMNNYNINRLVSAYKLNTIRIKNNKYKNNKYKNNLIYSNYNEILTNSIETKLFLKNKNKYCIILRGHVRDSFNNNRLYTFLSYLIKVLCLDIDIYIYTWLNIEAEPDCSWRTLPVTNEIITTNKIHKYFKDIPIKKLYIVDEKTNVLVGDYSGKIGGTSKKGWKNMWCGINAINKIVKDSNINYYGVINTRIDLFGNYIYNMYYRIYKITFFYELIFNYENTNKIMFWNDKEIAGIDNFYIGDIDYLYMLSNNFHNNLWETINKLPRTIHQEFYVYRYVKKFIK